ncbi:MAG: RNase adapter RapZ [Betaproteobacteria bacterium]|nr:RNase adapter RapZ [Betaproteobacteria bacterium]
MNLVLISGLSGSGKSIALKALEDCGYCCVDNIPSQLLLPLVRQLAAQGCERVAVAIDVRSGDTALLPQEIEALRCVDSDGASLAKTSATGASCIFSDLKFIFLDAKDDILLARFSETRRRHPLADKGRTLLEAISEERRRLEGLSGIGHHIDTSDLKPDRLREWIRQFIAPEPGRELTLLFQSFGFKHGLPLDADLVFDVRCLPNPHYIPELRPLTGRDDPVAEFLRNEASVDRMQENIGDFVAAWLPAYLNDQRSYLTVAIGCTGGQHRSVYLVETLAAEFRQRFGHRARVLLRHRELDDPSI